MQTSEKSINNMLSNKPNNSERNAYLQAMGIPVWEERLLVQDGKQDAPEERTEEVPQPENTKHSSGTDFDPQSNPISYLDWSALVENVTACSKCEIAATRTQTVFGVGNKNADYLFVGEAPGADEDKQGEPFVGSAGQLLNAILFSLDLKRGDIYIANVLKCRPPNNRDPKPEEVENCESYLRSQISLIKPKVIVALGRHAAHSLLKTDKTLGSLRGEQHDYHGTPLVVTYHPAYLLRTPSDKNKTWQDLCLAKKLVNQ